MSVEEIKTRTKFSIWLQNKYIVSYDQKSQIVNHNLTFLPKVMPFIMFFGIIMTAFTAFKYFNTGILSKYLLIYYSSFIVLSPVSVLWSKASFKSKKTNLLIKNLPTYFTYIWMMVLVLTLFFYSNKLIGAILVFASVISLSPILFYLEPFFYNIVLFSSVIFLSPLLFSSLETAALLDFYLYIFIMCFLSFYKWGAAKKSYEAYRINEKHAQQLDRELQLASNVQNSFYNHQAIDVDGWEIDFYCKAMAGITGDLFDVFYTGKKLDGFCICDVSGHGLSSGLVTMLTRTIVHRQFRIHGDESLENIMYRINSRYEEQRGNIENYMSGILFRVAGDKLEMVNAAHPYPIIYRDNEKKLGLFEDVFSTRGTAIGLSSMKPCFIQENLDFSKNDEIILYTDGITEALNAKHEEYGTERFIKVLQKNISKSINDQIKAVVDDVASFVGEEPASDDITLLILRRK